ncbi:sensor histidine kinase [Streptomyces indicus]|uniref:histidine kinase n=1 Tax=Streptomyces indicus TaxID=417292 RepID=A0A1G8XN29_9ACTN|nr:sensor domain-containing protein [Streptomyces indicus]SDJ91836.1 Signal transduction histidine kinase [Streptomyces indicus]
MTAAPPPTSPTPASRTHPAVRALDLIGLPASARARRELLYAAANLLPGLLGLLTLPLLAVAALLMPTLAGLRPIAAALAAGGRLAAVHRYLVRTLLGENVPAPPKRAPRTPEHRPVHRPAQAAVADPDSWRALAHALADVPVSLLNAAVQLFLRLYALAGVGYFFWYRQVRQPDGSTGLVLPGSEAPLNTAPRILAVTAAGLLLLALAGWSGSQVCALSRWLARSLLGPSRLAGRVRDLEATRALAVRDSTTALRRIERDLHDGAQARLVAVAMTLTRAHSALDPARRTDTAPDTARDLVGQALAGTRTAIEELRDLVRGIHPPALDEGLDAALASLTADLTTTGSTIRLDIDLPRRPDEVTETIAYFCAAELLTNATRHAAATTIDVRARLDGPDLLLTVRDDGRGGARPAPDARTGSGLAGLAERVRTVDGTLIIDSPPGGPTLATVRIPLTTADLEGAPCAS